MAAPYSSVRRKTEDAILALIEQLVPSADLPDQRVKGLSGEELTTPRLEIVCSRAEAEIPMNVPTGNYTVHGVAAVVTSYNDTDRDTHLAYMAHVEDLLMRDPRELVQMVAALGFVDYTLFWINVGEGRDETDRTSQRSLVEFEALCCPSQQPIPTAASSFTPGG